MEPLKIEHRARFGQNLAHCGRKLLIFNGYVFSRTVRDTVRERTSGTKENPRLNAGVRTD